MQLTKKNTPWLLLCGLCLVSAFIFGPYLLGKTAFVLGWDMRTLYSSNFEALRTWAQNLVATGKFSFWSWVSFLGNDFYSSKLFYFQDLFDYPFMFTNFSYTHIIMVQTFLKFLVAGFGFYAYSRYRKLSFKTSLIGSLIFAFSAYNLQTMMHPFFGSFFVFLPFYFLSVDKYLQEKKKFGFIFWVFFLFVNNYYLFYSVSLCTVLYFLYRYNTIHGSFKGWLKEALVLIGYYLIGFMLSGIVVIPEVMQILSNSRVGARSSILVYESVLPYLNYLVGVFTPTSVLANRNTLISSLYSYTSPNDSVMAVFLWASSIITLLFPQRFSKKNRKPLDLWMIGMISAIALIPILSSVMHGFSEASFRWLGSVSFFLVATTLPLLDNPKAWDKQLLKRSILVFAGLLVVTTPLLALIQGVSLFDLMQEYWLVLIFVPTLLATGWALYQDKEKVLFVSIIVELCLVSFLSFYGNPEFTKQTKDEVARTSVLLGAKNEYNEYLLTLDPDNATSFYRSYIDPVDVYWQLSSNYNLNYNIRGLLSYDSTFHPSANELKKLGSVTSYLSWTFDIEDPYIMNLVSTKYAVVTQESRVPFIHYEKVGDFLGIPVYENLDYINLGKTYTQVMGYDEYDETHPALVTESILAHPEDVSSIQSFLGKEEVSCSTAILEGDTGYVEITTTQDGFAVLAIPYDTGWKVSVNGSAVATYEVNGGLTGLAVSKGTNVITLSYLPNGLKLGALLSLLGLLLTLGCLGLSIRKSKPKSI